MAIKETEIEVIMMQDSEKLNVHADLYEQISLF